MTYSALPAKVTGDTVTITNYDAIKGNFEAGVPDVFTTKGDLAAASAADTAVRLAVGADDSTLVADSAQTAGLAWQIQPMVRVYNNASLGPYASAGWTSLTFNSENFDTDAVHSTVTNTSRLTVPSGGAGLYAIGACVQPTIGGAGNTAFYVRLLLNGTTEICRIHGVGTFNNFVTIETIYSLNATDYVEVQVQGVSDTFTATYTAAFTPSFWAHWLRRQ